MSDQAGGLRKLVRDKGTSLGSRLDRRAILVSIASGKGGVGKTQVALNLAMALSEWATVLLFDADMGTANLDVMLGMDPKKDLSHFLHQKADLEEVLRPVQKNLTLLPGVSGLAVSRLEVFGQPRVLEIAAALEQRFEFIILDTAAGISESIVQQLLASDMIILVCTEDPTSLVDGYALCKTVLQIEPRKELHFLANNVPSDQTGKKLYQKMRGALQQFMAASLSDLGAVVADPAIVQGVLTQNPLFRQQPDSPTGKRFRKLANTVRHCSRHNTAQGLLGLFQALARL